MMTRALAAATCLLVAACGSSVRPLVPQHSAYEPKMVRAFDDGVIPVFLVGEGDPAGFAEAMSGWRNGAELTFVPDGDTGASYGYRVVIRVEGRAGRIQDVCAPGAPLTEGEGDAPYANFAFCRGRTPITTAVTRLPDLTGPAFVERVKAATRMLFPRAKENRGDGGRTYVL